jgi:hypothetical protein
MMQQTNLKDEYVTAAEWDKATALQVNPLSVQAGKWGMGQTDRGRFLNQLQI